MRVLKNFYLFGFLAVLTACGGGGASSGGGSENGRAFSGTENLSVSFKSSGFKNSGVLKLDASVSGSSITIVDVRNTRFSGTISSSGSFSATGVQALGEISAGINCGDITVSYSGSIEGNTISGSSAGSVTCSGIAGMFTLSQEGTFSLTLN